MYIAKSRRHGEETIGDFAQGVIDLKDLLPSNNAKQHVMKKMEATVFQLVVNWWLEAWWFGILRVPLSNNPFDKGIPAIQTTNPNH